MTWEEFTGFCSGLKGAALDQPFYRDFVTTVARHTGNRKLFALIMRTDRGPAVNLKCEPLRAGLLRGMFRDIRPGWHMNHDHWITVNLSGDVPDGFIYQLTLESYELTRPRIKPRHLQETE